MYISATEDCDLLHDTGRLTTDKTATVLTTAKIWS